MGRRILLLASVLALASCVTEQTFIDSKKQVRNLEFDKKDAAKTRLILGLSYLENGRFEQAKFNLEKALEFGPKRADVNYSLGYYYQVVGEMELAEEYYLSAINLEPKNPDTLNNYGTFLCNVGNVEKAEVYFKKAINISKYTRAAESYENMAICALSNDQLVKAEDYFEMSFKHNPSRANNVVSLAGVKYANGDLVAALDFYGRYLRLNNPSARGLLLGYILETRRGRVTQANKYANQLKLEFAGSREALYFTTGQVKNSEFEQLRKKFSALSQQSGKPAPKIRITRKSENKLPAQRKSTPILTTSLSGAGMLAGSSQTTISSLKAAKELRQKVRMFSAPLTDSESIEISERRQKTVALAKATALPEEQVLLEQVPQGELINDRAATEKSKRYLNLSLPDIVIPKYEVVDGDNLYRVSVKFNVQILNLMEWNQLKKEELDQGQVLFVADPKPVVEVEEELLLSQLASQYKVKLSALMAWNKVESDGWIKKGTRVLIMEPSAYLTGGQDDLSKEIENIELDEFLDIDIVNINVPTHKVANNEFLYTISTKYNIKINALIRWNGLESESDIKVGQILYLANPDIYYEVTHQQKLSDVANHLQLELSELMAWNNVKNDGLVKAGTKLLKVNAERYQ